jgi:ribonuclease R
LDTSDKRARSHIEGTILSERALQEMENLKYSNPIPVREAILSHLRKRKNPMSLDELAQELKLKEKEQLEALHRRLKAMKRDGQLVLTSQKCYVLPKPSDLLHGKVIGHRDGYGFLRFENKKDDVYLSSNQMKSCIHGDTVLAKVSNRRAWIIRILKPRSNSIVGRYFENSGTIFIKPDDNRLNFNIVLQAENTIKLPNGFIVIAELTQRATRHSRAIGKISRVLGDYHNPNVVIDMALRSCGILDHWPEDVKKQIHEIKLISSPSISTHDDRIDLRTLPLVTIDDKEACDLDDAIYCERERDGGWKLWVAIADVSYYVRPDSPLDNEAYQRGTSIYFPSRVIPMLPEIISNNLCSLQPNSDRLCVVCELSVSDSGKLLDYKHYEAIMCSHARLTYDKVYDFLRGHISFCHEDAPFAESLENLHLMYKSLEKARQMRGGISFETEEAKFILNTDHRIKDIRKYSRNVVHKIVEECMILANVASAKTVEKYKASALFRDHDHPSNESLVNFSSVLKELGLVVSEEAQLKPIYYAKLLAAISERPDSGMLQTMFLRLMKPAVYDSENRGHFGLSLPSYTHFTSPIRRYPDLLMHRIIKTLLAEQANSEHTILEGAHRYSKKRLLHFGQHCSMAERRADDAVRIVTDWLKCDFIRGKIGHTFTGIISSVTSFGLFVRINDIFIDGLVHISNLGNNCYNLDSVRHRLISHQCSHIYYLGDLVRVSVSDVDMDSRRIHLKIVSTSSTL